LVDVASSRKGEDTAKENNEAKNYSTKCPHNYFIVTLSDWPFKCYKVTPSALKVSFNLSNGIENLVNNRFGSCP